MANSEQFIDWCVANGWQQVVQVGIDRQNAAAYGASRFSQPFVYFHKRDYYRDEYLKSDHWKQLRSKKLDLTPHCERCPSCAQLDVHHRNYRNLYDVLLSDLETLCRGCHDEEHVRLEAEKKNEWTSRLFFTASWLNCDPQHLAEILALMGFTECNLCLLNDPMAFKFGMFKQAFSTRPVVHLRCAFSALLGKTRRCLNNSSNAAPSNALTVR